MRREHALTSLAVQLGVIDRAAAEILRFGYEQAVEKAGSHAARVMTFEVWALQGKQLPASAVQQILDAFAHTNFRCRQCGKRHSGAGLGASRDLLCPGCGSADLVADSAALAPPPQPSGLPKTGTRRVDSSADFSLTGADFEFEPLNAIDQLAAPPQPKSPPGDTLLDMGDFAGQKPKSKLPIPPLSAAESALPPAPKMTEAMEDSLIDLDSLAELVRTNPGTSPPPGGPGVSAGSDAQWRPMLSESMMPSFPGGARGASSAGPPPAPPLVGEPAEGDFDARVNAAAALVESCEFDRALADLNALASERPGHPRVRTLISSASDARARVDELMALGRAARAKGDLAAADAAYLDLRDLTPPSFGVDATLAQLHIERGWLAAVEDACVNGDYAGALAVLDDVAQRAPATVWLRHVRGQIEPLAQSTTAPPVLAPPKPPAASASTAMSGSGSATGSATGMPIDPAIREQMERHDELIAKAMNALDARQFRAAGDFAADAQRLMPSSAKAAQIRARLSARQTQQIVVIGAVAAVLLVIVGIVVVVVMSSAAAKNELDTIVANPDPAERARALTSFLATNPGDEAALLAQQSTLDELRTNALATAVAIEHPESRLAAVTEFLKQYPDDAAGKQALDEATRAVAQLRASGDRFAELNAILETKDPRERLGKLEAYAKRYARNAAVLDAIASTQVEIAREEFVATLVGLSELEIYARLRAKREEIKLTPGTDWGRWQRDLDRAIADAEDGITRDLVRIAAAMDSTARAREFLSRLDAVRAVDAALADSLDDQRQRAIAIQAEDVAAEQFVARAAGVERWNEATELLDELNRFVARVPRLKNRLEAAISAVERVAKEKPPTLRGFTFLRVMAVRVADRLVKVNVYRCEEFAGALNLPAVPLDLAERARTTNAPFTRADVEFVLLPPVGMARIEFEMGSPDGEAERASYEGRHRVVLTRPYLIARTELSQAVWRAVLQTHAAKLADLDANAGHFKGDYRPLESVSWEQAKQFCDAVNLRLPTEAEWSFACRAGTDSAFFFGATIAPAQVNFNGQQPYGNAPRGLNRQQTVPVGSLPANHFGLFEMHGNVAEWTADWFDSFPEGTTQTDPTGPTSGRQRVFRGGHWNSIGAACRTAAREAFSPTASSRNIGFRPAATPRE